MRFIDKAFEHPQCYIEYSVESCKDDSNKTYYKVFSVFYRKHNRTEFQRRAIADYRWTSPFFGTLFFTKQEAIGALATWLMTHPQDRRNGS